MQSSATDDTAANSVLSPEKVNTLVNVHDIYLMKAEDRC